MEWRVILLMGFCIMCVSGCEATGYYAREMAKQDKIIHVNCKGTTP